MRGEVRAIRESLKLQEKRENRRCPIAIIETLINNNSNKTIRLCPQKGSGCSYEYSLKCPLLPELLGKYLSLIPYQPENFCPVMVLNGYPVDSPVCKCNVPDRKEKFFPCWACKIYFDREKQKTKIEALCIPCSVFSSNKS